MDVKLAFLNGVLEEEIYMEQPQGFITTRQETKVCHLRKAIYGLKQASCAWNLQFHGVLVGLGFKQMMNSKVRDFRVQLDRPVRDYIIERRGTTCLDRPVRDWRARMYKVHYLP